MEATIALLIWDKVRVAGLGSVESRLGHGPIHAEDTPSQQNGAYARIGPQTGPREPLQEQQGHRSA